MTISPRTLKENAVEVKGRRDENAERVPRAQILATVRERLDALRAALPGPPPSE